jgi:hypothetical protein
MKHHSQTLSPHLKFLKDVGISFVLRTGSKVHVTILALVVVALSSCAGTKSVALSEHLQKSNCNQEAEFQYAKEDLPQPLYELPLDTMLTNRFSLQALNTANAIGLLDVLRDYIQLKLDQQEQSTWEGQQQILAMGQKINQRLLISSLEISAVASELDCEEERADQIASFLKGREDDVATKLTVGAIVIGAVGAITAGVLIANGLAGLAPEVIGIGTGLTEASLGVLLLKNTRKVSYLHQRNALKDIWEGPETSTFFPPAVWYYLNYENENQESLRKQLVTRWLGFGQLANSKEKHLDQVYELFFGTGGQYTADQLANRADMHDQIESYISLMKQDLKMLALEVDALF